MVANDSANLPGEAMTDKWEDDGGYFFDDPEWEQYDCDPECNNDECEGECQDES